MTQYLVTVKLPRNPKHNPRKKMTGDCPMSADWASGPRQCTDVTGEHHTFLFKTDHPAGIDYVLTNWGDYHITRIEEV